MMKLKTQRGRAMSVPGGLIYSGVVMLVLTILLSLILAGLLEKEIIPMEKSGYGVMILLFSVTFTGSGIAAMKIKHRKKLFCLLSGLHYFLMLMAITALFYGAQYEAVGETALVILSGSAAACFLLAKNKTGRNKIAYSLK